MPGIRVLEEKIKNFIFNKKNENKVIACAFIFNVAVYWFYYLFINLDLSGGVILNDYDLNFTLAIRYFLNDPRSIYTAYYLLPYRNLPATLFYYMIFYFLPTRINVGFYVCSLWLAIWNLGSCVLIMNILKLQKFKVNQGKSIFSSAMVIVSIYLLNLWQPAEYYEVNTNIITGFFVLLGTYFFLSDREHLGYMAWSIAIIFKMTIIFLIPFFIFQPPFKKFARNCIYALIPQIPNFIMFAMWPSLIRDYISSNFSTSMTLEKFFPPWGFVFPSGSIARQISWYLALPVMNLAIPVFIVFYALNLFLCYKLPQMGFINRLLLAFLTIIVTVPDFVANHILFFIGVYLLWLSLKEDRIFSKSTKIIIGLPLSYIIYHLLMLIPFPSISFFFFVALLIIDYRLIISLKKKPLTPPIENKLSINS